MTIVQSSAQINKVFFALAKNAASTAKKATALAKNATSVAEKATELAVAFSATAKIIAELAVAFSASAKNAAATAKNVTELAVAFFADTVKVFSLQLSNRTVSLQTISQRFFCGKIVKTDKENNFAVRRRRKTFKSFSYNIYDKD